MKKVFLLLTIGTGLGMLSAQSSYIYQHPLSAGTGFTMVQTNAEFTELEFRPENIVSEMVVTASGTEAVISLPGGTPLLSAGFPDLPKVNTSIIIPDADNMAIEVLAADYTDYTNIFVAPSKGTLVRTVNPADIPYTYGPAYTQDAFWPSSLASLSDPYILRDYRAQTVVLNPVQYNPVTKVLRVYTYLKVKISSDGTDGENILVRNTPVPAIDKEFDALYGSQFLNYGAAARYSPVTENGSMLIIADPSFETAMTPFVNWKIQRGMKTVMVNTTVTGTTSSDIKTYIQNYYAANADLKYVLLVGDDAQVPAQQPDGANGLAGPSDNFYGYLSGNDRYPEIFIGRFSAENTDQVTTQVNRSITYEKTPPMNGEYGKSIHIGSDQGPGDDGEMDFEHQRGLKAKLMAFTYTYGDEFFDGNQGGADDPSSPAPQDIVDAINDGRGLVAYTGHGWDQGLGTSGFSSTEVPYITNDETLPFFWSVACVNGNFTAGTCFAETLLRSEKPTGEPIGAVAALMSTINQYWSEPMEGQDAMVDLLTGAGGATKRTFGALSMNGCMQMNDSYGSSGMDMTDTWTCFGDPSLLVRTATPQVLTTTYTPTLAPGSTHIVVNCSVEGTLVAVTMNNIILGTAYVTGGSADVTIPAAAGGDVMIVTATAFNYAPSIHTVTAQASTVGIENNLSGSLVIYPNPATDFITLECKNGLTATQLLVYDMSGRTVFTYNNTFGGKFTVSTEGWAQGMYTFKVCSGSDVKTVKCIIR